MSAKATENLIAARASSKTLRNVINKVRDIFQVTVPPTRSPRTDLDTVLVAVRDKHRKDISDAYAKGLQSASEPRTVNSIRYPYATLANPPVARKRIVGKVDVEGREAKAHILRQRQHVLNGTKCEPVPQRLEAAVAEQLARLDKPYIFGRKPQKKISAGIETFNIRAETGQHNLPN